jgi:hypothetical protein
LNGEYHWIDGGQAKLQLEVETFPIADQIVIINNMFKRFKTTRKFGALITNELLKILYRSVRALKNQNDTQNFNRGERLNEVRKSIFRFGKYSSNEIEDFINQLYINTESGEIRGMLMYLQYMARGAIDNYTLFKNQLYTYLKFMCLSYNNEKKIWELKNLAIINDYVVLFGNKLHYGFENLEKLDEDIGNEPDERMIKETDYMLKRAHEIEKYATFCRYAFIDMNRILKIANIPIYDIIKPNERTFDSYEYNLSFSHIVQFIRGVIISLRDVDLYNKLNILSHVYAHPPRNSSTRQSRNKKLVSLFKELSGK